MNNNLKLLLNSFLANNRELSVATMLIIGILLFLCIVGLSITLIIYKKKRKPSFSHDTNVSCSETKNSKQPDIIKSRQGIRVFSSDHILLFF